MSGHRTKDGWSRPRRLGPAGGSPIEQTIDREGTMTVAWAPGRRVAVVSRPAGGDWGEATELPGGFGGQTMDLATNNRGDLALAWEAAEGIRTALRTGDEKWVLGPELDDDLSYMTDVEITLDEARRMIVMWGRDTEWGLYERRFLAWAVRAEDGSWSRTRHLDSRENRSVVGIDGLALTVDRDGDALAAWSTEERNRSRSRSARFDVDSGQWDEPVTLGRAGVDDVVVADAGAAFAGLGYFDGQRSATWWLQRAGEAWQSDQIDISRSSTLNLGTGRTRVALLTVSDTVEVRFLDLR